MLCSSAVIALAPSSPEGTTTSAAIKLSQAMPKLRVRKPKPPPSVAPASPTVASPPVGTAKPSAPSVVTTSPWVNPAPTVTVREPWSSRADFISLTSMTIPPVTFDQPSRLWRPLRARTAMSFWHAKVIALTTSSVVWAKTIAMG